MNTVGSITFGPMCNCTGQCMQPGGRCPISETYRMRDQYPTRHILPGESVIGTCSICRGAVTVPALWGGIVPPTPKCSSCGATKKQAHGPVIDMEPRK